MYMCQNCCSAVFTLEEQEKKLLTSYATNGRIVFEIVKLKVCKNSRTLICFSFLHISMIFFFARVHTNKLILQV